MIKWTFFKTTSRSLLRCTLYVLAAFLLHLCFSSAQAYAWPLDSEWIVLTKSMSGLTDRISDAQGGANDPRDIVTNSSTYPAAYIFNDGTFMYFRIRVDGNALTNQGDSLQPFGWGLLIDTDNDFSKYEWMVMLNGIANPDAIEIGQNITQGTVGDPSDKTELTVWTEPWQLNVNFRSVAADSFTNGGQDYFLDFRIPYATFKAVTGLTDTSPIRFFIGSSSSAQSLTADLVDISNVCSTNLSQCMSANATDPVIPLGTYPSTGSVTFVSSPTGTADMTQIFSGQTIYIRVEDADVNTDHAVAQTLTVTLTTQGLDRESVTLTETGPNTGIFTGSIATSAQPVVNVNGTLEVAAIETVTVSYTDLVDASFATEQVRTDSLTVQRAADLAVSKTSSKTTPAQGDTVVYTVTVANNGPGTATGIQVTDQLPAGVAWVSDTGAGAYNRTTGVWEVVTLATGSSASLAITSTVTGSSGTTVTNTAAITASAINDPVTGNNSASSSITIGGADLSLTKTANNTAPPSGGAVTFTIVLKNNGSADASGVMVHDLLSAATLSLTSSSATQGSYNGSSGDWAAGSLISGATATLTINATVTAAVGATVTNTASITASNKADPNTANNSASATLYVSGVDLSLSKGVTNTIPNELSSVTYTLTVTNNGLYAANVVTVADVLPSGVTYLSSAGTGTYAVATGVWSVGTVTAGASASHTITVRVNAGTNGTTITNTASITGASLGDPNAANNTASKAITVQRADLSLLKTASNPSPNKNQSFSYAVVLTNNGPDPATNIVVRDSLDTGNLTYNSAGATAGSVSYAAPVLTWTVPGPLASGATTTLTINMTVKGNTADGTTVHNLAEIVSVDQADPLNGNNSSLVSIVTGVGTTDLALAKTVDTSAPVVGQTVTYTLLVTNPSGSNATNVTVTDLLPAGLTFSAATTTWGSYNSGSGVWNIGAINAGAGARLSLAATVNGGTLGQSITNTANISGVTQQDINLANNTAAVSLIVGATDLAVTKTVSKTAPSEGEVIVYTVAVRNNGPNDATNVVVTDQLASGLTYTGHSVTPGSTYTSGSGAWSIPGLVSGATATLSISAQVNAGTAGTAIVNVASRTSADQPDTVAANNSASASITVQSTDLYISKTVDHSTPNQGSTIVYTLTVGNSGPDNATGVAVADSLPAGLAYLSAIGDGAYNSATGVWTLGPVAKNAVKTLAITAQVVSAGTITNTAVITGHNETDPNTPNNTASLAITAVSMPQIVVVKTSSVVWDPLNNSNQPKAIPGAIMQYTVIVTNSGGGTAQTVSVKDVLDLRTELFVGDLGGPGLGPVVFADGGVPSGLTYTFGGLNNLFDCLSFSIDGTDFSYAPIGQYDPNITHFKVTPTGTFNGAVGGNNPSFSFQFQVRIK